jgi:hypothetical protein
MLLMAAPPDVSTDGRSGVARVISALRPPWERALLRVLGGFADAAAAASGAPNHDARLSKGSAA